jgi:hypothetical protein
MGFKLGQKRPEGAGRKKGSLNKLTKTVLQIVEESGVEPLKVLLGLCTSPDEKIAVKAASEVCQYIYPKRKAIEHSFDPKVAETAEAVAQMTKEEQIKILEQELKRLKGES